MRGRKPKPKAQLRLVGTYRADRHHSPDPPATTAECPEWLNEPAKAYWPRITVMLAAMHLDSSHYAPSIALLCDAVADFTRFSDMAANAEPVIVTDKGNRVQNPIIGIKNKAWERVLKSLREFGMSPSALRSISIPEGRPADDLDKVLA
jgi:P27 family predicted phage terminase small subunit